MKFSLLLAVSLLLIGCSHPKPVEPPVTKVLIWPGPWSMYQFEDGHWKFVVKYPNIYICLEERDKLNNENKGIYDCLDH